ncbi:hypothetical protein D3C78_1092920 [compost metagenome]
MLCPEMPVKSHAGMPMPQPMKASLEATTRLAARPNSSSQTPALAFSRRSSSQKKMNTAMGSSSELSPRRVMAFQISMGRYGSP